MVKEIVESIVEAEKQAQDRIYEANAKASEMLLQAQSDAENKRETGRLLIKKYLSEQDNKARAEADIQAAGYLDAQENSDKAFIKKANENLDKAVQAILESLK